jgi:peptidoglycan-associated lipoprotein
MNGFKFKTSTTLSLTLALFAGLSACSSKKAKTDGETAGDTASMAPTDVSTTGQEGPIADLPAVYFAYDSFQLAAGSKAELTKAAEWLKTNSTRKVQIQGHTDERGTTEYNLALGERRSGAVKDFLVSLGVSAGQLSTISYGEERPSVDGHDESAWSKNRRAEFFSAVY